jgi:hypothetical protein
MKLPSAYKLQKMSPFKVIPMLLTYKCHDTAADEDKNQRHVRGWCVSNNYGVTHFVIVPSLSPISTIWFDAFHLQLAIADESPPHLSSP